MSFPYDAATLAAIDRLLNFYNSGNYDVVTNPGGFGQGGHRVNFINAQVDEALVANSISDAASSSGAFATAAGSYAAQALASAARLTATSATSQGIVVQSKVFVTQADKLFPVGGFLLIRSAANPSTNFMQAQITAYSGTSLTVDILIGTGSGTYSDWLIQISGSPGAKGDVGSQGVAGTTPNVQMTFSNGTGDSDPGNGLIKFNNATIGSVTQIYIDDLDRFGVSISTWVGTFDDSTNTALRGYFKVSQANNPAKYAIFSITAATAAGSGYQKLNVVYAAGPGGIDNAAFVVIDFIRTGDKGLDGIGAGDIVGPVTAVTDNAVMLFDGTTGKRAKSGGALALVATSGLASNVTVVPAGSLGASSVQAALAELDDEKQPIDALLTALAALATAANKGLYFTASDTPATFDLSAFMRGLQASASAAAMRAGAAIARAETAVALGLACNPFVEISQENGTSAVSTTATSKYGPDQWVLACAGSVVASISQVAAPFAVNGYRRLQNGVRVTITTTQSSLGSADGVRLEQPIEGTFWRDLGFGTADAVPATVLWVVSASVAGDYVFYIQNAARDRTWAKKVTLAADTPTVVPVPVGAVTGGTWPTTNAVAAYVGVTLAAGTGLHTTSLETWNSDDDRGHASAVNMAATMSATFTAGFMNVYPASVMPFTSASDAEILATICGLRRPLEEELRRCERYYAKYVIGVRGYTTTGIYMEMTVNHRVPTRVSPSITYDRSQHQFNATTALAYRTGGVSFSVFQTANSNGAPSDGFSVDSVAILNARM